MKLVLFDCDGTLVDSQHVIVAAMTRAFARADLVLPPREAVLGIVGLSLVEAMRRLGEDDPRFPAERLAELYREAFRELRAEQDFFEPLFPGVRGVIDKLAARDDVVLGIATGKSQRGVAMVLGHHGLDGFFSTIQTADDAPSKPHPAMVLQAMAATGAEPEDTVLIGDTSFDMVMARAAGARAIGVTWGYHTTELLRQSGAERLVSDADELMRAIDEVWEAVP
ncbi:HAD-superfamily hydrolase, subfamily IA, variant 1 [Ancylobacter novellus DSM 506]|uniref:HAD-superfamily hydrolase, subfamily IA, variant 1 n=1 Tax=Ancylobacter novellus (strain ATCC 8093 / DSM 506 / JCM 20403 / CCM 1077 / IAM 12100 / NBRC 12443 / NCIMB 10456) TaxID=639283 RepID=D7A1F1_ANCN5|nr:HAD-IA family hydrolase [Ancylobacter novellus]ADH89509.1 HAD-superfamily hydrolase, subfamily IA, variant 1 [Ancylobacter novellus DSM 506]